MSHFGIKYLYKKKYAYLELIQPLTLSDLFIIPPKGETNSLSYFNAKIWGIGSEDKKGLVRYMLKLSLNKEILKEILNICAETKQMGFYTGAANCYDSFLREEYRVIYPFSTGEHIAPFDIDASAPILEKAVEQVNRTIELDLKSYHNSVIAKFYRHLLGTADLMGFGLETEEIKKDFKDIFEDENFEKLTEGYRGEHYRIQKELRRLQEKKENYSKSQRMLRDAVVSRVIQKVGLTSYLDALEELYGHCKNDYEGDYSILFRGDEKIEIY